MYTSDGRPTHYVYYPRENGQREPTGLLCLGSATFEERRRTLDSLRKNGEFACKLPRPVVSMKDLRSHLQASGY